MTAPLIGLTGRRIAADQVSTMLDILSGHPVDMYFAKYSQAVSDAGGEPLLLPLDSDPAAVVPRLDGLLLSGGADIAPDQYGHEPGGNLYGPEPERDAYEFASLAAARAANVPVLGICRGIQIMNVAAGGTLHQHVPEHSRFDVSADTPTHEVELAEGSALHELYGDVRKVNSLHHQVIDEVGDGYRVVACAPSGEVEGLEAEVGDVLGVQWHPEMMAGSADDPIFGWLIDKAQAAAGR